MEGKAPLLQVKSHLHHLAVVDLKGSLLKNNNNLLNKCTLLPN